MRKLYRCDDCGCTVSSERDLDTKEDGTKICPECGSTSIDVYGFLYELESYDPRTKHMENGELDPIDFSKFKPVEKPVEIPGFEKTSDVLRSYKKMTEGWKK